MYYQHLGCPNLSNDALFISFARTCRNGNVKTSHLVYSRLFHIISLLVVMRDRKDVNMNYARSVFTIGSFYEFRGAKYRKWCLVMFILSSCKFQQGWRMERVTRIIIINIGLVNTVFISGY